MAITVPGGLYKPQSTAAITQQGLSGLTQIRGQDIQREQIQAQTVERDKARFERHKNMRIGSIMKQLEVARTPEQVKKLGTVLNAYDIPFDAEYAAQDMEGMQAELKVIHALSRSKESRQAGIDKGIAFLQDYTGTPQAEELSQQVTGLQKEQATALSQTQKEQAATTKFERDIELQKLKGEQGMQKQTLKVAQTRLPGANKVQASKILPGGLVQIVRQDGTVETVSPKEAEIELIKEAEKRGASLQGLRSGEKESAKNAIKLSTEAFKSLRSVQENIANMSEGIKLLKEEGAKSGFIESRLPSIRSASIKLDNLQGRLGLDVIRRTTFGSLSEAELRFALDTSLPQKLDEPALANWLEEKQKAQIKLSNYLQEAAIFLGTPGNSAADFLLEKQGQQLGQRDSPLEEVPKSKFKIISVE